MFDLRFVELLLILVLFIGVVIPLKDIVELPLLFAFFPDFAGLSVKLLLLPLLVVTNVLGFNEIEVRLFILLFKHFL